MVVQVTSEIIGIEGSNHGVRALHPAERRNGIRRQGQNSSRLTFGFRVPLNCGGRKSGFFLGSIVGGGGLLRLLGASSWAGAGWLRFFISAFGAGCSDWIVVCCCCTVIVVKSSEEEDEER